MKVSKLFAQQGVTVLLTDFNSDFDVSKYQKKHFLLGFFMKTSRIVK